jgi:hypothetical protein
VPGHAHRIDAGEWLFSGQKRQPLGCIGNGKRDRVGDAQARRTPSDQPRYVLQHLRKRDVLGAQDIALADFAVM